MARRRTVPAEAAEKKVTAKVETAEAPPTDAPSRYADEATATSIAERLAVVKERGFTRPMLMELAGMNGSAMWRAQNRRIHPSEVVRVTGLLDRIESGELAPPERKTGNGQLTRAELEQRCTNLADRLRQVAEVLDGAQGTKTVKDLRGVLDHARTVLGDPANVESTGGAE